LPSFSLAMSEHQYSKHETIIVKKDQGRHLGHYKRKTIIKQKQQDPTVKIKINL